MTNFDTPSILVRFRFDGDKKSEIALLTYDQYFNIKNLPISTECKIVKNEKPTLSKNEIDAINKKLSRMFSKSRSHTQSLSE